MMQIDVDKVKKVVLVAGNMGLVLTPEDFRYNEETQQLTITSDDFKIKEYGFSNVW